MFEPITLTVVELATRWNRTPRQVLEYVLYRHIPVLFAFHGLAFNMNDRWLRANGERDVAQELSSLKQNISAMEMELRKHILSTQGQAELGEFEQQSAVEEIRARRRQIDAFREQYEQLFQKLEQRESDRRNCVWNGLLRAPPVTLQSVAVQGHASFPYIAYHPNKDVAVVTLPKRRGFFLDGHLLALEDALGLVVDLTAENLYVSMIDVKAVEAASATVSQSDGGHVPGTSKMVDSSEAADVAVSQSNRHAWVAKAQGIGASYLEKHKINGLFPSQQNVADHVAKILRSEHVLSDMGKPLSSAYILRNALQGAWWKRHAR